MSKPNHTLHSLKEQKQKQQQLMFRYLKDCKAYGADSTELPNMQKILALIINTIKKLEIDITKISKR